MSRTTAPALRRGLDILELFVDNSEGLRVPDITQMLDLPRASAHELVATLVDRGYLEPVPEAPNRFVLGVRAFRLGAAYERDLDLASVGRESARKVASACGETVQIVIRDGSFAVFIVRIDSTHSFRLVSHVGSRLPAYCTAGGKVLLASVSDGELGSLFPSDDELAPMTPDSIDNRQRLFAELTTARERGWAEENKESNVDVACVAAPVRDRSGTCVAAMSISVPIMRWSDEGKDNYVRLVLDGANEMSSKLGWLPSR
ncbi:IclR family transcriptional regulator [Rhodococcus wratislaviensis]|uniref:Putative IclR family transcriptional regulator n=1 Tax=Rhodococcus wratislaviensis NBRC 100605 TaxID=1219028 RepID=X0RDE5_RHOWR|nr:IclR family transcriptional regulator [Rhodococcus wratislaviensis]GAF49040.1 putative IclR family transcriptional regulator [Rhodococcus wratislaviensis NBRC 100605]